MMYLIYTYINLKITLLNVPTKNVISLNNVEYISNYKR